MSKISFYHVADLHLDSPFRSISKFPKSLRDSLVSAPMNAFKNLVSKAIEDRVSFVLISGDIFDKPAVSLKVEHNFFSCIRDLSDNNIGIFIIFGNHDSEYFQAKRDFLKEIPGLNFFPLDSSIGSFEVNDKRIVIYGMNYSANSEISSLSRLHDKNSFKIAMYHGDILAIPSEDSFLYGLLRKNDLLKTNIDYWALGHLHQFNVINKTPYIIYPGTPQGRSFKPAECGDKGCVKVTISDNKLEAIDFVVLSEISYFELSVEVKTDYHSSYDLFNEIRKEIELKINEQLSLESKNIILRINLDTIFSSESETFSHSDQTQIEDLISKEVFTTKLGSQIFLSSIKWNFKPEVDSEIQSEIFKLSSELLETDMDRILEDIKTQLVKPKLKMKDLELLDPSKLKEDVLNQIKRLTIG